jgi:alpha-tubulin suppressor-like RCC1 family protein/Ca2+-binding EF-hand superfamily protein
VLVEMGKIEDEVDADVALAEIDTDGDGSVSFAEFEAWFFKGGVDLRATFAAMDTDGDGTLSHREFREGLRSLGIALPVTQVDALLASFDKDGDGEIDYQEFAREFQPSQGGVAGTGGGEGGAEAEAEEVGAAAKQPDGRSPEAVRALALLQRKLDRRGEAQLGSRAVRMLVEAMGREAGDPCRLCRPELRLVSLLIASAATSERAVHALQSFGATTVLTAAVCSAAAAAAELPPKREGQSLMFPRQVSVEALFALAQLARFEETHASMMAGSLVPGLLSLQRGLGFSAGDNVEGFIVPRLIGLIVCRLAAPPASRARLLRENGLPLLVTLLYANPHEGGSTDLHLWALRTSGIDASGASTAVMARGGLSFPPAEIIQGRLLQCALRLISSAPDPTVRRFAISTISVCSEHSEMLTELAAFEDSAVDYSTISATCDYACGSTDIVGCREVAHFLRNMIKREDLREQASAALPLLTALAWTAEHDPAMALFARESLVTYCQSKASKYEVAKRRARLTEALVASGLAIPALLAMASYLIDAAQHQAGVLADEKEREKTKERQDIARAWRAANEAKKEMEALQRERPQLDPATMNVRDQIKAAQIDEEIAKLEFTAAQKMTQAKQMEDDLAKKEKKAQEMVDEAARQQVLILFKKYDQDMSGELDEKELALLLADLEYTGVTRVGLGGNKVQEEYRGMVHDIFVSIDTDGGGSIEPEELAEWYKQREGVGDLVSGQIEDAELARFCVATLVALVRKQEQDEAEQWGKLVKQVDAAGEEAEGGGKAGVAARKERWKQMLGKTKAVLTLSDKPKPDVDGTIGGKTVESSVDRAARLMSQVLGRMRRNMLEVVFLSWAEETRLAKGRASVRFRCVREATVRSSFALSSPKVGTMPVGTEVDVSQIEIMRFGISRLKFAGGWVSDKDMSGRSMLERLDQDKVATALKDIVPAAKPAPPEVGTLIVKVIGARGLPKMDFFGSVDAFAIGTCAKHEHKTSVVKRDRNPVWNHTMEFKRVGADEEICVQVFDYDVSNANDPMGQVRRNAKQIGTNRGGFRSVNDRWFALEPMEGADKPTGEIRLRCEYRPDNIYDKEPLAESGTAAVHFYLSTDPPPWTTLMNTIVPLLICNDMSVRTAMANLARYVVTIPVARRAFVEVKDSVYNLLVLYATFHPPIKRDCAHAISVLVREVPGMADRLCHKLKWTAVAPLLSAGSSDTIIGAMALLREIAANCGPQFRKKVLNRMMAAIESVEGGMTDVIPKNIRRAQTSRMGTVEFADAPELALPTFMMLAEIVANHSKARMRWCRSEEACHALLWHVSRGPAQVRRAAAKVCALFASHMECQENLFAHGADRLIFRFPHHMSEGQISIQSTSIEQDKPTCALLGCCIGRLACHSQNQLRWIQQGGLTILHRLLELRNIETDASVAAALSALASNGHLTVLSKGVRMLSKYANVALAPLGKLCHSKSPTVKQLAVNAVWQLSKQLDDLSILPAEGGIATVFPMLYTSSQRVHTWASQHLLTCAEQHSNDDLINEFVEPSNFMCMIKCVRTTAVAATRKRLEDTIYRVCDDPGRRETAFTLGSYYTLQILAGYDDHLDWAVHQLHALSVSDDADADVARHVCAKQGGFRVIAHACRSMPIRTDLCILAAEALSNFSAWPSLHPGFMQDATVVTIATFAVSESEEMRKCACTAMQNISKGPKEIRVGLEEHISLTDLQGLLDSSDEHVVASVMQTLANITIVTALQRKAVTGVRMGDSVNAPLMDSYTVRHDMFNCIRQTVTNFPTIESVAQLLLQNICRCNTAQTLVVEQRQWQALLACSLSADATLRHWTVAAFRTILGQAQNVDFTTYLRNEDCLALVSRGFTSNNEDMMLETMHATGVLVSHCVVTLDAQYRDGAAIAEARAARKFLAVCGLVPLMEGLLSQHSKFEDRTVMEVMNAIAFVSGNPTGCYADSAAGQRAAKAVFQVLHFSREQEFLSETLERRQLTVQMTALRALASLCTRDSVRAMVVDLFPLSSVLDACLEDNVTTRPAACRLLLELSRSAAVQVQLLSDATLRRFVSLVRVTHGLSRGLIDRAVGVLALLPQHKDDLIDLQERRNNVERREADMRKHERAVALAEKRASEVRGVQREKADVVADELKEQLPRFEQALEGASEHVAAWHGRVRMFNVPDLILAVLRNAELQWEVRLWFLNQFVLLVQGDPHASWYAKRPKIRITQLSDALGASLTLGSEKLDPETVHALLEYGTSSDTSTQVQFLVVLRCLASTTANHSHIIMGDAIATLAGLCDSVEPQVKEVARDVLRKLLHNFAVMRHFESRPDSHQMVILASRLLADDNQVQRWSSELLAHAPNPALVTLQLLNDQDTGMGEELDALRSLGAATSDTTVQLNIASRLCKLCQANSKVRAQVCQVGGIDTLYSVISSPDSAVQLMALRAALAISNDSVHRSMLLKATGGLTGLPQPNVASVLCRMLATSPAEVKCAAMEVLAALAVGDSRIREQFRKDIRKMPTLLALEDDPIGPDKQFQQQEDARSELTAELARRENLAEQAAEILAQHLVDEPEAWNVLRRAAAPHPPSALAAGRVHSKQFICGVVSAPCGRELLKSDESMVSLVVYIERGKVPELVYECRMLLATKSAAEQVHALQWNADPRADRQAAKLASNANKANAFPHLIDSLDSTDAVLRRQCLRALVVQLRDAYASKECLQFPILKKIQASAEFADLATRQLLGKLMLTLMDDERCCKRFCRKGYFNVIASLCDPVVDDSVADEFAESEADEAPAHELGELVTLRLLEREDAKVAAVHGVCISAFRVALQKGHTTIKQWCCASLVELGKDLVKRIKIVRKAARMKSMVAYAMISGFDTQKNGPVPVTVDTESSLTDRAMAFASVALPWVQDHSPEAWLQAHCLELLRHVISTDLPEVIDSLGSQLFQLTMQVLSREAANVQIEACKLLEVLIQSGFSDFTSSAVAFTSLRLYDRPPPSNSFFGQENFSVFDVAGLRTIPALMQSWLGTRMMQLEDQISTEDQLAQAYQQTQLRDTDEVVEQDDEAERNAEMVKGSKVNPHQLLLAVTAPLLESLDTDARMAALRLVLSLSAKFQQFRVRLYLYDVLPVVVRLALSAGNERIFRHTVVVDERNLAKRVVCHLISDEATRQWLVRGWNLAGTMMIVQSYEPVMLGIEDDEAGLRSSREWMANSLLSFARAGKGNCETIAAKALTVLLSMISSSDLRVRHASLRCIAIVLAGADIRERTAFDAYMVRKELLRNLYLNPASSNAQLDDLQELVDRCILGLLRDASYVAESFDGDHRTLLVLARRGNAVEHRWVVKTLQSLAPKAAEWPPSDTRCVFDALAALICAGDSVIIERVACVYETILALEAKKTYFLDQGGVVILSSVIMASRPKTQTAGLRALKVLLASDVAKTVALQALPGVLAAYLDMWYASYAWELRSAAAQRPSFVARPVVVSTDASPDSPQSPRVSDTPDNSTSESTTPKKQAVALSKSLALIDNGENPDDLLGKAPKPVSLLGKRFQKAAKKMATLSTIPRALAKMRAEDRAANLDDVCTVLEMLMSFGHSQCRRDFLNTGAVSALSRTLLLATTAPHQEASAHSSHRVLATAHRLQYWGVGDTNFDDAPHLFPSPLLMPKAVAVKEVACCSGHMLALGFCGQVFARGRNDHGQLGMKASVSATAATSFAKVESLSGVTNVACGGHASAAVCDDGTVRLWGCNAHGQSGRGYPSKSEPLPMPAVLAGKHRPLQVSLGERHVAMVDAGGQLWTWGDGELGQLGHGDIRPRLVPTLYSGFDNFARVVCGPYFNVAITRSGQLITWGDNTHGQLGLPPEHNGSVPAQVSLGRHVIAHIAVGLTHAVALTTEGTALSWGDNRRCSLGRLVQHELSDEQADKSAPALQDHVPRPVFLCGLRGATEGPGEARSIPDGQPDPVGEAAQLRHHERVVRIACGADHTVLLTDAGLAYVAGEGSHGQGGRLDLLSCATPRVVMTMTAGGAGRGSQPSQHLVDVYCTPHGTVFASLPCTDAEPTELDGNVDAPGLTLQSYAQDTLDEYLTDLRVLGKTMRAALFPTSEMARGLAQEAAKLAAIARRLCQLHQKCPEFPREPKSKSRKKKATAEVQAEAKAKAEEAGANFRLLAEAYAEYTEVFQNFVEQYGQYLDVPRVTDATSQLWPSYGLYDVGAMGVLAQDFCSDWARDSAIERAMAGERIGMQTTLNLLGRERHDLVRALPHIAPHPAAQFSDVIISLLRQFGHQPGQGSPPLDGNVELRRGYEGHQWRFRGEGVANVALLNLLAIPMQRSHLYLEMLTIARAQHVLREQLRWVERASLAQRPAFAEVTLDLEWRPGLAQPLEDSAERASFERDLVADLANGLDVPADRFLVIASRAGSIKTTVVIVPAAPKESGKGLGGLLGGRSRSTGNSGTAAVAEHLVERLRIRSKDPNSLLRRQGRYTSQLAAVARLRVGKLQDDVVSAIAEATAPYHLIHISIMIRNLD